MTDRPDPSVVHKADQMGAGLRLQARILAGYRQELEAQGFTPVEALELCLGMQEIMCREDPNGDRKG